MAGFPLGRLMLMMVASSTDVWFQAARLLASAMRISWRKIRYDNEK